MRRFTIGIFSAKLSLRNIDAQTIFSAVFTLEVFESALKTWNVSLQQISALKMSALSVALG